MPIIVIQIHARKKKERLNDKNNYFSLCRWVNNKYAQAGNHLKKSFQCDKLDYSFYSKSRDTGIGTQNIDALYY